MSSPGYRHVRANKQPGQWSMRPTSAERRRLRRKWRKAIDAAPVAFRAKLDDWPYARRMARKP